MWRKDKQSYEIVKVSTLDGEPIGYAVWRVGTEKFEDTNLWTEKDSDALKAHVADQNHRVTLQEHWPDAKDPEVEELINDPEFEPLKFVQVESVTPVWLCPTTGTMTLTSSISRKA